MSVVVLGDLGRSPRMQYHCLSLAEEQAEVDVVGYLDSELPRVLIEHPRIHVHQLATPRSLDPRRKLMLWLDALTRSASQTLGLLRRLLRVPRPRLILLQNPPAIPTLLVAWLAARLRRARLVIDWHNFGYTVLALKLGTGHPLVKIMKRYERVFGRLADAHFCVSRAMRRQLVERWGLRSVAVLYDRPPKHFQPTPAPQRQELFRRLGPKLTWASGTKPDKSEPTAILISPTSWTPDEDFSLLLEAARTYEELSSRATPKRCPRLLVLVTGRGALHDHYKSRFDALDLRWVQLRTLWLTPDDYPQLLGAADLGLCFHSSSSGLDLPMKISDMLGSGLPVCAFDYGPVLGERLTAPHTLLFTSGEGLGQDLFDLLRGYPEPESRLGELRAKLRERPPKRWHQGWREEAGPTVRELLS